MTERFSKRTWFTALALSVALGAATLPPLTEAHAQCPTNPDSIAIIQGGRVVGEIFRADPDPENYVEHWVLYPGYIYPSPDSGVVTELRPGYRRYGTAEEFFENVPFQKGSRYVKVDCADGTTLPGR